MIADTIRAYCSRAARELYNHEISPATIGFEKTKRDIDGDFTLVVFPLTRYSGKSPEATAKEIGDYLSEYIPEVERFNVIKGFLNLVLTPGFWLDFLRRDAVTEQFGISPPRDEAPVILEYSSPNTNKPLHLGHIRNNLLGYSLSLILKANGFKVIKVNLVNDRGIHICKSMLAYMKWGDGETPQSSGIKGDHLVGKYYVLFDNNYKEQIRKMVKSGISEDDAIRGADLIIGAQELLRRWEAQDPEVILLWKKMNGWAYEGFSGTYSRLGVSFDRTDYESDTYLLGRELVLEGLQAGHLNKKPDGSVWVDLHDEGLDEKLLLRADGTSVYMTQDLGTAERRFVEFHPSRMIYVVGNEQLYHFDVLRRVLKKLGKPCSDAICHLSYGMVELPEGKMKSREGTVVDADDLMEEMYRQAEETTRELGKMDEFPDNEAGQLFEIIGLGALKYFILKVDPRKNMLFDPKESIDFNGNTGPFIQYTHARIQSLLRKAADLGYKTGGNGSGLLIPSPVSPGPLERGILRILYQYPSVVQQAGEELSPALIANFVYELSKEYNQFYQEVPVLREEDEALIPFRLLLSAVSGSVIRKAMTLLGIVVPDRM